MTTLRIADGRYLTPETTVERGDVLVDRDTGEILSVGEVEEGEETINAAGCVVDRKSVV